MCVAKDEVPVTLVAEYHLLHFDSIEGVERAGSARLECLILVLCHVRIIVPCIWFAPAYALARSRSQLAG